MGSVKENYTSKNKQSSAAPRSKGDRLGWKKISEQEIRSLRDRVGEGERVERNACCFFMKSTKLLVP